MYRRGHYIITHTEIVEKYSVCTHAHHKDLRGIH